jgi:spore photoproduct lyase
LGYVKRPVFVNSTASNLLDIQAIYLEPRVLEYSRGREILWNFPDVQRIEVASHWNIPGLHGNEGLAEEWLQIKKNVLVLGVKKSLQLRPNGRSADFIAPSAANGCAMSCAYCYVPRRKGYANPISVFVNIENMLRATQRHASTQGAKIPNSVDENYWVYELGENNDCSVDALLSDNIKDAVALFRDIPNAKATWATKFVNRKLLKYDPQNKTRIRFSLMPPEVAKVVDVRTSPMRERIAAINDFVEAGYEVHLNFSPVIITENWLHKWDALFEELDGVLTSQAKAQLACEIIFLTHNEKLHDVNLKWHPKAETLLWTPHNQQEKTSLNGDTNVRYKTGFKGAQVRALQATLKQRMPYCRVRYAF